MNNTQKFDKLVKVMDEKLGSGCWIKFKDESLYMKFLGKILFFNKDFMTKYVTTSGKDVYFPSHERFLKDRGRYFKTLCHEYVHIQDYILHPVRFTLGYLFPQILSLFSLGAIFAIFNLWFLLFLLALLFLAPLPAPWRARSELRGKGMNCKVQVWSGETVSNYDLNKYVDAFTTSAYYFMWPFKKRVVKKLRRYIDSDECLSDRNSAYADVHKIITS
jgi:hypothetical protein